MRFVLIMMRTKSMNKLLNEVILQYNQIENNSYKNTFSGTIQFFNKYSKELGVEVKRNPKRKLTDFYYNKYKIGSLRGLRVLTTTNGAFDLCRDKFKLEKHLENLGFSSLNSKLFSSSEYNAAKNYIDENPNHTYVLKPLSLAGGMGIELNIDSQNFEEAWENSIAIQRKNNVENPSCIIQRFVSGFDVRISIIEGKFSAAALRLPSHIVGNGQANIKDLITRKNEKRLKIKYFTNKLIPIDNKLQNRLSNDNKSLSTVLDKDEIYLLSDISNLTLGGESIDISDIVSEKIKMMALKSVAAIPGLYTGGVDMMTEDFTKDEAYIIEVNTNANHTMHHIPLKGKPKEPFRELIEMFIVKNKIKKGIQLENEETLLLKDIYKFSNLKDSYADMLLSDFLNS